MESKQHSSLDYTRVLKTALGEAISWSKVTSSCRFRFEMSGVLDFEAGQHVTAHAHPFYEFGVVLAGVGELQLRRGSYELGASSVYVVIPGVTHRIVGTSLAGLNCLYFHVTPERIDGAEGMDRLPGIGETKVSESRSLNHVIQSWAALYEHRPSDVLSRSLFARFLSTELLALLATRSENGKAGLVERAKNEIERRLPGKIEVSQLSRRLGVSERTLRRHFQKALKGSVMDYVNARRLHLAKIHLTHHLPVAEVARLVGFESGAQLSRLFRKNLGISPKAWQKSISPTRRFPSDVQ